MKNIYIILIYSWNTKKYIFILFYSCFYNKNIQNKQNKLKRLKFIYILNEFINNLCYQNQ